MFCCMLLCVRSSIAIILMGKRELVALLNLSSWCLVMVERLFLAMPQGCLRFVIVVFPDHTHLLFLADSNVDQRLSFFAMMLCTLALRTVSLFFFGDFEDLVLGVEHGTSSKLWVSTESSRNGSGDVRLLFSELLDTSDELSCVMFCDSQAGQIHAKLYSTRRLNLDVIPRHFTWPH